MFFIGCPYGFTRFLLVSTCFLNEIVVFFMVACSKQRKMDDNVVRRSSSATLRDRRSQLLVSLTANLVRVRQGSVVVRTHSRSSRSRRASKGRIELNSIEISSFFGNINAFFAVDVIKCYCMSLKSSAYFQHIK